MEQLKSVRDEFLTIADDINKTLVNLDRGANLLQSRYHESWEQYALRYNNGSPCGLATQSDLPAEERARKPHDSVLCAAWYAVNKGFPKHNF